MVEGPSSRILILVPDGINGKGGIERLMLYLVRELRVVAPHIQIGVHATRMIERWPINHLTTPVSLAWFTLRCLFGRYDVLHCNIAPRGSTWRKRIFVKVAQRLGLKVVLHLHGSGYDAFFADQSPQKQMLIKNLFNSAQKVVVLGNYWHRFALNELGLPEDQVRIINNGAPDVESRSDPTKTPPLISFVGLIGERKGVDVLIEALDRLPTKLEWRLAIGGNGEIARFRSIVNDHGLGDRIRFLGWMNEVTVDELLTRAQIFVLPSRAENQPMSILEAMARGLPVVSTKVGAIPEQVLEGKTGLVVPPGDIQALAEALQDLITNSDRRMRMGLAGREHYETNYSIKQNVERFIALYYEVCTKGQSLQPSD